MQNPEKVIHLSRKNISKFGFSCFHYKEELHTERGFQLREIQLVVGGSTENRPKIFKIPNNLLIEISKKDKIVNSENYRIGANHAAIAAIKLLSERAGWNQTLADLEAIDVQAENGNRLAWFQFENHEIILGSGLSLPVSNDMSWIGMILVHPELRRQGIARSIMNSCLEHARLIQNKAIIGLDATPQGKQVYDSLGFVDSYKILRSDISTTRKYHTDPDITLKPFALDSIKVYLSRKRNAERYQIVELLAGLPNSKNIMAVSDGLVSGFVMSRPGRTKPFIGPIIADSDEVALSLLNSVLKHWKSMEFEHVFIDVPELHIGQKSIFINEEERSSSAKLKFSIKPLRSFVRMYQLIPKSELPKYHQNSMSVEHKTALEKASEGYAKTLAYMEKEKHDILPSMYAIGGPEMS